MSFLAYINVAIAVIGLFIVIYAIREMPFNRCAEPMVGDALVLVAYLLMINSHWMAQESDYAGLTTRAWHAFDLVVLINIIFHARQYNARRNRRKGENS